MILDRFRLDGRVALVTGGNRGIGRALAIALAQAGADIALLDRTHPTRTVADIEATGRRALVVPGDLATAGPDELADAVHAVVTGLGGLHILVNNAGIIRRAVAVAHPAEDWDAVLRVNLNAVFHLSQAAGRIMLDQGHGKIVNIASMLSYQGGIRVPSYTAAKHAVVGLTRALANEWAAAGVNVNAIAPGYVATDNTAPLREDPDRERAIRERIPAGRWGAPDDLTGAIVFLASDAAHYVHGVVVPVDGGWLAR
ncbi:2-deoxy-D-gluconate 3-dehydrogenase [Micromonospora phaseoli]|uniref:2-deoxy-D-gluconate 3-dehydrogenase n=1 Tax=Micromonospora phaseoli TaxID=1144548 RepID=A0A1H7C4S8_9ACTN|nr:2-dehydro-3-deoxy-D-gluconate 5-dehydrogenase KduD [Micromonospora phaseoli]PZV92612.1 2-deoxy-D-gluconate 3-dehydrogenase [Micromonospora phaseoli]GIJ76735.1 2-deoxy-D-gluconate 3-dehydrogenase [Micromonospora phaseoli]SEJ84446.1 2-deoxy-D-gluconate 3-dehydrogenase [Micromonospora phaseoli]